MGLVCAGGVIMTLKDAKELYEEKFGGVPNYFLRGVQEKVAIDMLVKAVETNKEIEAPNEGKL